MVTMPRTALLLGALLMGGCVTVPRVTPPRVDEEYPTSDISDTFNDLAATLGGVPGQDYRILTALAGTCTAVAVVCFFAAVATSLPIFRRLAAAGLCGAVCLWTLRVLLVKYMWLAVLLGLVAGVLYLWGHRKWIERKTGLNITPDGKPPGVE